MRKLFEKIKTKLKCFFGQHVWFYRQFGMMRELYCVKCNKVIFPIGEDC